MSYQPNPFVDPNQRGFELPAGCKDLNDVLGRLTTGQLEAPCRVSRATIGAIRGYVAPLYAAKAQKVALVVTNFERGALLIIARGEKGVELTLVRDKGNAFLAEALTEVFGETAFKVSSRPDDELQTIQIALPAYWDDAAQRIIDLLIRGYGLSENAELWVQYQERKEPRLARRPQPQCGLD